MSISAAGFAFENERTPLPLPNETQWEMMLRRYEALFQRGPRVSLKEFLEYAQGLPPHDGLSLAESFQDDFRLLLGGRLILPVVIGSHDEPHELDTLNFYRDITQATADSLRSIVEGGIVFLEIPWSPTDEDV